VSDDDFHIKTTLAGFVSIGDDVFLYGKKLNGRQELLRGCKFQCEVHAEKDMHAVLCV
jgi:hypothetical protein